MNPAVSTKPAELPRALNLFDYVHCDRHNHRGRDFHCARHDRA